MDKNRIGRECNQFVPCRKSLSRLKLLIMILYHCTKKLGPKIKKWKDLGMPRNQIAIKLNVSIKTVKKSLKHSYL